MAFSLLRVIVLVLCTSHVSTSCGSRLPSTGDLTDQNICENKEDGEDDYVFLMRDFSLGTSVGGSCVSTSGKYHVGQTPSRDLPVLFYAQADHVLQAMAFFCRELKSAKNAVLYNMDDSAKYTKALMLEYFSFLIQLSHSKHHDLLHVDMDDHYEYLANEFRLHRFDDLVMCYQAVLTMLNDGTGFPGFLYDLFILLSAPEFRIKLFLKTMQAYARAGRKIFWDLFSRMVGYLAPLWSNPQKLEQLIFTNFPRSSERSYLLTVLYLAPMFMEFRNSNPTSSQPLSYFGFDPELKYHNTLSTLNSIFKSTMHTSFHSIQKIKELVMNQVRLKMLALPIDTRCQFTLALLDGEFWYLLEALMRAGLDKIEGCVDFHLFHCIISSHVAKFRSLIHWRAMAFTFLIAYKPMSFVVFFQLMGLVTSSIDRTLVHYLQLIVLAVEDIPVRCQHSDPIISNWEPSGTFLLHYFNPIRNGLSLGLLHHAAQIFMLRQYNIPLMQTLVSDLTEDLGWAEMIEGVKLFLELIFKGNGKAQLLQTTLTEVDLEQRYNCLAQLIKNH